MLLGARRYLAEHVAFAAASRSYVELSEPKAQAGVAYDRRSLIRLLDLSIGLLPDDDLDANDLRDRV